MESIDDIIKCYCPDGVKYKKLGDLGSFYGGLSGKSKNDFIDGNAAFVTYKNVYSNPSLNIHPEEKVFIADGEKQRTLRYGDVVFTGSSETPDECGYSSVVTAVPEEDLYLNSFCFFFRFNDEKIMLPSFAKHLFRSSSLRYQIGRTASGVTRYNVSKEKMAEVIIPILPIKMQMEIAEYLDNFTELTDCLEGELEKRRFQYQQFSIQLFDDIKKKTDTICLEKVCEIEKGKTPIQKAIPGDFPLVVTTTERKSSNSYQFDSESVCIPLVSSRGHGVASLNHVYYQSGKFALGNILCAITPINSDQLLAKYLYYYFEHTKDFTLVPLMKGGANVSLHITDIAKIKVPIPSLEEQKNIIYCLDLFDQLCMVELPAEIILRNKQYQFYRDYFLEYSIN